MLYICVVDHVVNGFFNCKAILTLEMAEQMSKEQLRKVAEENKKMKDAKVCITCKDRVRSKMFLPCSHITSCDLCYLAFTKCPQCKSIIRSITSVYI